MKKNLLSRKKRILNSEQNNLSNSPDIPIVKIKNEEKPPMELDMPVIKQKETKKKRY